jgi:hypothetical protein
MQFDNPKFTDPVVALRDDVRSYLARNHVTQKTLALAAGTTEQTLSDFLGKRGRGLQAETFARIQYLLSNNIVPSGTVFKSVQIGSRHVKGEFSADVNLATVKDAHSKNNQPVELIADKKRRVLEAAKRGKVVTL